MYTVVMIRHGESVWNKENKFTGWTDVDLSEKGREEAQKAGKLLKAEGFEFTLAYTSVLRRAINTLNILLDAMDLLWIPVHKDWRLNERHYGTLQGLNKADTVKEYGEQQVKIWRRSFDIPPPPLTEKDDRYPGKDIRYASLPKYQLPLTECLKDTVTRFLPMWNNVIVPAIEKKEKIIIAAHGNSLRALVKHLDNISDKDILELNIPTGVPLVYELNNALHPIKSYYLGDMEEIKAAQNAVANQGKT